MKKIKLSNLKQTPYIYYLPIIICMAIVPLIVKISFQMNPLINEDWYSQDEVIADFFLYNKGVVLIIGSILMVLLCAYYMNKQKPRFSSEDLILIPLIVLTAFELLSTLFSMNPKVSIKGMPDQYETIWVLIAYSICCIYMYYFTSRNLFHLDIIYNIILFSVLPVAVICAGQFFKLDIYRYIYRGEGYEFSFAPGNVYGPFYNINYVGSYVILFLPVVLAIAWTSKAIWKKIVAILIAAMLGISIYGSYSTTGLIALAAVIGLGALLFVVKRISSGKSRIIMFWALAAGAICMVLIIGRGYIHNYLLASDTAIDDFQYAITNTDGVEFGYRNHSYKISMPYDESTGGYYISLKDGSEDVAMSADMDEAGTYYTATDENLSGLKIHPVKFAEDPAVYGIELTSNDFSLYFSNQVLDAQSYYFMSSTGKWTSLSEENQSKSFKPLASLSGFANGRGYIWNKTIALIPKYILLGSGADTFACAYPNNDYIGNMNNGYYHLIMTKPHNLYLQYAIQSGLLSLVSLLVLFGWYFFKTLNLFLFTKIDSTEKKINFALFLGLTGYMITGIANDSTVTVAPVFWLLFGLGIALTNHIKKLETCSGKDGQEENGKEW